MSSVRWFHFDLTDKLLSTADPHISWLVTEPSNVHVRNSRAEMKALIRNVVILMLRMIGETYIPITGPWAISMTIRPSDLSPSHFLLRFRRPAVASDDFSPDVPK